MDHVHGGKGKHVTTQLTGLERRIADLLARRHGPWERIEDVRPLELTVMLVEDARAIAKLVEGNAPNLGLATTRELLDELRTRIEVDYSMGGGGLDYTTVTGRPEKANT